MAAPRAIPSERPRVLVAGGGVAALEALLALHELAGRQVHLELLAPGTQFLNRPASVAAPFGLGGPGPVPFEEAARRCHAELHRGTLAGVDQDSAVALTADGRRLPFAALVVAVGARAAPGVPGALAFSGPQDVPAVTGVLDAAASGAVRAIVFTMASGVAWTLPLYELAIMTAIELRDRGADDVAVRIVSPEAAPLQLFGGAASAATHRLLRERGIEFTHGRVESYAEGGARLAGGGVVAADAAIALPPLEGPSIEGLPGDDHGFIPVDAHGRVTGARGVYAAGDATTFPIKQGGLATQQADAAAEAVAADLGLRTTAEPFRPVLRGLLLTGGAPLYLRAELAEHETGVSRVIDAMGGEASTRALWWPPGKVAGRYLAPYLATARPVALGSEPLVDRIPAAAPGAGGGDATDALELTLLLADEDARAGDYAQALHALDGAAALAGGVLPAAAAAKREAWLAALGSREPARP
ncbi:MAG: FAD-dependent oxidoreductase [Solirubrobacteraceae bacterium]